MDAGAAGDVVRPGIPPAAAVPAGAADRSRSAPAGGGPSFEALLAREQTQVRFSGHARKRIDQRQLAFDESRLQRLERAVERAREKGSRDSLVLLDELALVVSVQHQTVVTAMDEASRKEHVFTNIDSVVIAD